MLARGRTKPAMLVLLSVPVALQAHTLHAMTTACSMLVKIRGSGCVCRNSTRVAAAQISAQSRSSRTQRTSLANCGSDRHESAQALQTSAQAGARLDGIPKRTRISYGQRRMCTDYLVDTIDHSQPRSNRPTRLT